MLAPFASANQAVDLAGNALLKVAHAPFRICGHGIATLAAQQHALIQPIVKVAARLFVNQHGVAAGAIWSQAIGEA